MATSRSVTLLKTPRRMRLRVISAKKRSTRLSQDDEVGVKCRWKRGCCASHAFTVGMLVGGVVVDDQVQVEVGRRALVDDAEEPDELLVPVPLGMQRPITVPSSTLRAANSVVVPWRL